jgi:catechol 2,3-dioxygenase-like lactoylglutathione lyase family enzyme
MVHRPATVDATMADATLLTTGVDFVCIPAQDFDAMTTFYGETLGLPLVKRYSNRPDAEYQAGNLRLAIMRTEELRRHLLAQRDAERSPSRRRSRRAGAARGRGRALRQRYG